MEAEGSGRGGPAVRPTGPQETSLQGQGAEASPGHPHMEDTGPHTKACESTNREDSENSVLDTHPDQHRAQGDPRTASREAKPGPARPSTWPASRTDPGTRGPWEFMR